MGQDDPHGELDDPVTRDVEHGTELTRLMALARHIAIEPVGNEDKDEKRDIDQLEQTGRTVGDDHNHAEQQ